MTYFFAIIKILLFFILLAVFLIHGFLIKLWTPNIWKLRQKMIPWVSFYSKVLVRIMNIQIKTQGSLPNQNELLVSNHLSYLDIIILSSIYETSYITSIEIKNTPLLGTITDIAGCLYVERRNRSNLENEMKDIKDALNSNMNVTLFPEATSTNGTSVLPFKKALFQCAIDTLSPVRPLCINYEFINNKKVDLTNRDLVCWYGNMDFLPHLFSVMKQKSIFVQIHFLKEIQVLTTSTKESLSQTSYELITKEFKSLNQSI